MSETFKMDDGRFVIDETNYNRFIYKNTLTLPENYKVFLDEIRVCENKIQENTRKIKEYVTKDFTPRGLPATFKCVSVEIKSYGVEAEWISESMRLQRVTRLDPDKKQDTPKEKDAYQLLAERYDFKQILNSGVLTKEEKRKCLGLPELDMEERKK